MPTINRKQDPWPNQKKESERSPFNRDSRYHTAKWRRFRLRVLQKFPFCVECKKQGLTTASKVCDHILPVRLGGEFWDENNCQGLCESCHNRKSALEGLNNEYNDR